MIVNKSLIVRKEIGNKLKIRNANLKFLRHSFKYILNNYLKVKLNYESFTFILKYFIVNIIKKKGAI